MSIWVSVVVYWHNAGPQTSRTMVLFLARVGVYQFITVVSGIFCEVYHTGYRSVPNLIQFTLMLWSCFQKNVKYFCEINLKSFDCLFFWRIIWYMMFSKLCNICWWIYWLSLYHQWIFLTKDNMNLIFWSNMSSCFWPLLWENDCCTWINQTVHALWPLTLSQQGLMTLWKMCLYDRQPGPWFNIKILVYQYRKSHCGDYKNPLHLDVVDRYLWQMTNGG